MSLYAGIIVHHRNDRVTQTDSIRIPFLDPRVPIQPTQHLLMPHQAVLRLGNPVALIWEVQKTTRDTTLLQDIEETETLCQRETIVFVTVDDQLRRGKLENTLGGRWIPATVIVSIAPECAIELREM